MSIPGPSGSLRVRLNLLFALILLLGGALILVAAHGFARRSADEAYDRLLAGAALTAMESLTVIGDVIHFDLPYASLDTLSQSRDDRVLYRLMTERRTVLTGYDPIPEPDLKAMSAAHERGKPYFFTARYQGEDFRFVVLERQLLESGLQDKIWLQMGQSRLARRVLSRDLTLKALQGVVLLILPIWLLVWLATGWLLRPLLVVEQELRQRQPADLKPLVLQVPSEASQLVEAINHFMGRLQRSQDRNHAFIAEAAHQLRTPLASLQAQAELASEEGDAALLRKRAERIRRNARETNNRINQLLSYATLAHRADVLEPIRLALEVLVVECLGELAPLALTRQVALTFDNQVGAVAVMADPEALREVLHNLIDNALKHGQTSAHRTEVNVSLQRAETAGQVVLQVRDYGPGIPPEQLNQVTNRFGRGESRLHSGSGLGLAIVAQIMHGLGGQLQLENGQQGGLKVRLYLPEAKQEEQA
ncbi:MAG: sensor histidine kinase [Thiothrix sp.]|nr:sensor histidine kinase [Thiothrix sp.]HPE60288.1 sensor histidine kinase [Thiolinea sp.]